ncbi:MAG: NUDIX domain-containing protein, partial [Patescibacteria group bacterium]
QSISTTRAIGMPFWKNKDVGCWSLPKGRIDEGEGEREGDLLETAKREFVEETGFEFSESFISLGSVGRKDRSKVYAWAFEGDCDPAKLKSNTIFIDWPPRTGEQMEIPEVDRGEFFDIETAKERIVSYQLGLIEAFEKYIEKI